MISTLSYVNTVYVGGPNTSVFDGVIETNVHVVDVIWNFCRKRGIKNVGVRCWTADNVLDSELEVVDVDVGNKRSKATWGAPTSEPKRRIVVAMSPLKTLMKYGSGVNDSSLNRWAAGRGRSAKHMSIRRIYVRQELNPKFVGRMHYIPH